MHARRDGKATAPSPTRVKVCIDLTGSPRSPSAAAPNTDYDTDSHGKQKTHSSGPGDADAVRGERAARPPHESCSRTITVQIPAEGTVPAQPPPLLDQATASDRVDSDGFRNTAMERSEGRSRAMDGPSKDDLLRALRMAIESVGMERTIQGLEDLVGPTADQLADSLISERAILQFLDLVITSRNRALLPGQLPEEDNERLVTLYELLQSLHASKPSDRFYRIVAGIRLVKHVDKMTRPVGGRQVDPEKFSQVCSKASVKPDAFGRLLGTYRKLGPFDGLACFLPFQDRLLQGYTKLSRENAILFSAAQLPAVKKLSDVGCRFIESLWSNEVFPEYLWESRTAEERSRMTADALTALLVPFSLPDWPRPLQWPKDWPWPARPDSVVTGAALRALFFRSILRLSHNCL